MMKCDEFHIMPRIEKRDFMMKICKFEIWVQVREVKEIMHKNKVEQKIHKIWAKTWKSNPTNALFHFTKGPFTHSIEKAVLEASSTFYQSFIEFFVVMHEIFDEASMTAILN